MGCDIHMHVEAKDSYTIEGKWRCIDLWKLNPYYGEDEWEREYVIEPIYRTRNYVLFTALAGVRSTGDNPCISNNRGLPEDVTDAVRAESDRWNGDGHSHGWATLKELVEASKQPYKVEHVGMVSPEQALELDTKGIAPDSWCAWTSDKSHVQRTFTHTYEPFDELIKLLVERAKKEFWVFGERELTDEQMENIRIVFWFDN